MGGISRPSQICVTKLLEIERVRQARRAVGAYFTSQRARYGKALASLGFELFTGDGGFYHWARLPGGLTGDQFNERLFRHEAGILPGRLCDMSRRGDTGAMGRMMRFSFGPLSADSYDSDLSILAKCV
jgi:DNA-binding transcriptional MocR family regulator